MPSQRPAGLRKGDATDLHETPSSDVVADDKFSTGDDTAGGDGAKWGITRPQPARRGRTDPRPVAWRELNRPARRSRPHRRDPGSGWQGTQ